MLKISPFLTTLSFRDLYKGGVHFLYSPTLTSIHDYWTRLLDKITRHDYLTRWAFAGKVMSLLFNMLSRLVIAFLPKSELSIVFTVKPSATCWGI